MPDVLVVGLDSPEAQRALSASSSPNRIRRERPSLLDDRLVSHPAVMPTRPPQSPDYYLPQSPHHLLPPSRHRGTNADSPTRAPTTPVRTQLSELRTSLSEKRAEHIVRSVDLENRVEVAAAAGPAWAAMRWAERLALFHLDEIRSPLNAQELHEFHELTAPRSPRASGALSARPVVRRGSFSSDSPSDASSASSILSHRAPPRKEIVVHDPSGVSFMRPNPQPRPRSRSFSTRHSRERERQPLSPDGTMPERALPSPTGRPSGFSRESSFGSASRASSSSRTSVSSSSSRSSNAWAHVPDYARFTSSFAIRRAQSFDDREEAFAATNALLARAAIHKADALRIEEEARQAKAAVEDAAAREQASRLHKTICDRISEYDRQFLPHDLGDGSRSARNA